MDAVPAKPEKLTEMLKLFGWQTRAVTVARKKRGKRSPISVQKLIGSVLRISVTVPPVRVIYDSELPSCAAVTALAFKKKNGAAQCFRLEAAVGGHARQGEGTGLLDAS